MSWLAIQFTVAPIAFPLVVSTDGMQFRLVINVFLRIQDNLLCVIRHRSSWTVSIRPNTKLEDLQDKVNAVTKLKRKTAGEMYVCTPIFFFFFLLIILEEKCHCTINNIH